MGKTHVELDWEYPNNYKYMLKRNKFGCVKGDMKKYKGGFFVCMDHPVFWIWMRVK